MKNKRRKGTLRLKPNACQPTQAETESRTAALVAVAFLALHVLPVVWRSSPLWGTDLLFYLSPLSQASSLLAAVLLFVPVFRRQVRAWLRTLPFSLWEAGRRTWLTKSSILLASLAAFVALRTANHLLGDGYLYLRELDGGHPVRTERAPLAFALIQVLHSMGGVSGETAESTYRLYSYASGVLFVLLCFPVAGALGKSPREKSIALAFLLTGGYLQLFFGYVETYALCMPGILLYLLLGLRVLENRMSILFPAILLVLLVNLHLALALLGPSLLLLGYHSYRNRREASRWKTWLDILSVLSFLPASAVLFLWLTGIDLATYLSRMGGSHLLPVLSEPGFGAQYRLFSLPHFLDFCNLQVLAAPGACMTLAILDKRAIGHRPFLLAAAAFPLLFTFLANPEIGAFRDWDFLALPAVPLTIWAASAFLARMRDRKGAFHAAFPICGSAALHSLMWVGLNASPTASEARYAHLMDGLTGHAASYGWETLGSHYYPQPVHELNAYKRALEVNPGNPRHWASVGMIFNAMDKYEESIPYLRRAIQMKINPNSLPNVYFHLGVACANTGRMEEAKEHLQTFLKLSPKDDYLVPSVEQILDDIGAGGEWVQVRLIRE